MPTRLRRPATPAVAFLWVVGLTAIYIAFVPREDGWRDRAGTVVWVLALHVALHAWDRRRQRCRR